MPRKRNALSRREAEVLAIMVENHDSELVCDGNVGYLGSEVVDRKTVGRLIHRRLVSASTSDSQGRGYYTLNKRGEKALAHHRILKEIGKSDGD
jgi:hypothetical protein